MTSTIVPEKGVAIETRIPYFGPDRRTTPPDADALERRVLDSFTLSEEIVCKPRTDDYDIDVFTEQEKPERAVRAWELQGMAYVNSQFVAAEALVNGCLPPSIDKSRGPNTTYRIATRKDNPADQAAIRKKYATPGIGFRSLSSYQMCERALSKEGLEKLERAEAEGYEIVDITSLGTSSPLFHAGAHALFRDIVQDAMKPERKERWFFGIVVSTFNSLVHSYGVDTFDVLGEDVPINDPGVRPGLLLRPTLVHPDTYIDTMVSSKGKIGEYLNRTVGPVEGEQRVALRARTIRRYERRLIENVEFFTDGLTREQMSPAVFQARQAIVWSHLVSQGENV